ncbi:PAS domain S-box protein [Thiocystis violacea]|uniref:PAS domain S-box protein n=1 Tax=Thiocystis violacea TaxID=13725 RepID=UPI001F5BA0EC|nr:PAS domain S-box protein [Thiocystis violacea]MBK1717644.1 histidine kinase [Thiocystis violacea]
MSDPLRLLLLEDNPADAELNARILRRAGMAFESRRVEDRDAFLAALAGFRPHAILADFGLPHFDGRMALRLTRERDPDLPFIFVTGALGEEGAVELLRNGASDYILKDRLARLPDVLDRVLETARQRAALREAEQALKASEERFRTLVETTLDWIWEIDAQGRYTYVSPISLPLLGYAPDELRGRRPFALMPPEEARRVGALFEEIACMRRPFAMLENICRHKDGRLIVLESSGTPIFGADGEFLGYRGVDRDITSRKNNEAVLLLQARRATGLLELPRAAERMEEVEFMQFGQELAEELTQSQIAFIHFVNEDQETIELATWSRRTVSDHCQAADEAHCPVSQAGIWAEALRRCEPVMFNDYATTTGRQGLPDGHADLKRLITLPVMEGERVRMMAGVGNKPTPYTELDVETVQLIANETWRIVRQRRSDQALRESEERLDLALAASELGLWDWRVQTGVTGFNDRWAGILGFTLESLQPTTIETWHAFCHPDDLRQARVRMERHFRRETPDYEAEVRMRHKDGHWVWTLERGKVVEWDADGRPIRMAGTQLDITTRKQTEESLRKLSLAVEQSPASIVITDLDARIEYANPAFTRVSGYELDEAAGQNPRILQSGHTPKEVFNDLWDTLGRGEVWRGEFHNRRKDGTEYVELATISPVREPDGRVTHYLAVKEDISERKRVEQELDHYRLHLEELVEVRTSERRLAEEHSRLILESSADGLFGVDIEGQVTFINPAACAMLGYTAEQLLGRSTHGLIHNRDSDGTPDPREDGPVQETLRQGRVMRQDEDVFWRSDGQPLPVTYSSHPIYRDGGIVGAVVSFFDISAQKQTEAAREVALAEAERLARLKSEFLANMSHEIRTPLNAVLGFAQVGAREHDARRSREFFEHILDSGRMLLGIVDDILDFSKIEAGKLVITNGRVDLREAIERSADLLRIRAKDKGLSFRVEESEDLPASFVGDDLRLAQILGNLLSNAIKFTEHGEVDFAIERHADWLLLRVTDTGIGMREDQLANLFHHFEQADGSITRRFGGSGLGLAISKRLVEMMGGEIQARSRFGEGSLFEVRLPLVAPQGRIGERRPAADGAAPSRKEPRLLGLRILVAEDNPANRLVLEELLKAEGCRLVQVENGLQAVERIGEAPTAFDLVLMDIQMPVMDGFEATLRIHERTPELPIIGLTAHAMPSERGRCLSAGMVDHIAKPVDLDQLVETIRHHSQVRGATGSPMDAKSPGAAPVSANEESPPPDSAPRSGSWVDWSALEARYAHNPRFLPNLISTTLESNADQSARLREAASQGDSALMAFIAHRLKGTAGNLFAKRLHDLAANLEESARARYAEAPRLAYRLAEAMESFLEEIGPNRWPRDQSPPERTPPMTDEDDAAVLPRVLEQLESLLADDDTSANQTYDRHQALLRRAFGEPAERLGAEIKRFDYQAASDTLTSLRVDPASRDATGPRS